MHEVTVVSQERVSLFQWLILATLTLTSTLYAMSITIANIALPQLQGALAVTQDQITWTVTFNIVGTAIVTPMTGWLTKRFGQRHLMLFAVFGFAVSSIMCGQAGTLTELVVYRVLQGAFGGPLVPLSQAIILGVFPRSLHSFATAIWGMGVVCGPIIGPTVGGYISEAYSWRWVFYIIAPFSFLAFLGSSMSSAGLAWLKFSTTANSWKPLMLEMLRAKLLLESRLSSIR